MNKIHREIVCGLTIVFLLCCGCRRDARPEGMPALRMVTLTVTQEEKPLAGALVLMLPENTDNKWTACCITDEDGKGIMRTEGRYFGVPEGRYKLTVSKQVFDRSQYVGPLPRDPWLRGSKEQELVEIPYDAYDAVDLRYGDAATTPLTLEVTRKGVQETFDVGKAVKERIRP